MGKEIVGYRKFSSKKGNLCVLATLMFPYSDSQLKNGACGMQSEDIFIPECYHNLFTPQVVGKNALITYTSVNGRAYIESISIE